MIIEVCTEMYECRRSSVLSGGTGWRIRGGDTWCGRWMMRKNRDGWIGPLTFTFSSLETYHSKSFWFSWAQRGLEAWWSTGGLIYSCREERENGKELRMLSQREGLCLGTGDLPRRKEGAQGLAPPLCLGVSHRLTSCWCLRYATGWEPAAPRGQWG